MRSGSANPSGSSSTAFTTEKIAVLAPIPSASAATAARVKPGLRRSARSAWRRSLPKPSSTSASSSSTFGGSGVPYGLAPAARHVLVVVEGGAPARDLLGREEVGVREVVLPRRIVAPAQRRRDRRARRGGGLEHAQRELERLRCDSTSPGRPHELPSGKSLHRKRGTPAASTMSLAQPMMTVGMPFASRCRAIRLTVWWQTGQVGTSSAASAPSSRTMASAAGASTSIVVTWLRLVGTPQRRGASEPRRPAATASRRRASGSQVLGSAAVVWTRS